MNEAAMRGFIKELEAQRNGALNKVARLAGELEAAREQLATLRREINEHDNAKSVEW